MAAAKVTHTEARPAIRPAAPQRAGRNFFRIRTIAAQPAAPARTVSHPARTAVATPKKVVEAAIRKPRRSKLHAPKPPAPVYTVPASASGSAVVRWAESVLGRPYRFGAAGPSSFDCSGLVMWVYAHFGIRLPHKASAFYGVGRAVPYSQIRPGDILVLDHGGHAAIAIGGGLMIHAPHTGDHVRIAPISGFSAARRIL